MKKRIQTGIKVIPPLYRKASDFVSERAFARSTAENLRCDLSKKGLKNADLYAEAQKQVSRLLKKTSDGASLYCTEGILATCQEVTRPAEDACLGVIMETREHPLLEKVVIDFINQTQCRVQIFHGNRNLNYIKSSRIKPFIDSGKVILSALNTDHIDGKIYNAIFLSGKFWKCLHANNKIFIFQTDSLLCPNSDYQLEDFLKYDYIGSWWKRDRPVGIRIDGGNGGLSIRSWKYSVQCLAQFDPKKWLGGEDGYFAFYTDLLGGKVARGHECAKFGTQHKFLFKSFGCHQVSSLSPTDKKKFLNYCPDSSLLL